MSFSLVPLLIARTNIGDKRSGLLRFAKCFIHKLGQNEGAPFESFEIRDAVSKPTNASKMRFTSSRAARFCLQEDDPNASVPSNQHMGPFRLVL
mmetsp:Transcript_8584/g.18506  ORF Transcript_8584/g.18506 Transcript_8584/m.18506 type:complete len:94 (+) Transcript_8584:4164-4445(+)